MFRMGKKTTPAVHVANGYWKQARVSSKNKKSELFWRNAQTNRFFSLVILLWNKINVLFNVFNSNECHIKIQCNNSMSCRWCCYHILMLPTASQFYHQFFFNVTDISMRHCNRSAFATIKNSFSFYSSYWLIFKIRSKVEEFQSLTNSPFCKFM